MDHTNELIRRAVAGDEEALVELLAAYGPQVERSLSIERKWRTTLEPADVMQVTYLEAFLQIQHFDPRRPEPFSDWLRRIAENNLRDALRGLQRQKRPQPGNRVESDEETDLLAILGVVTTTPSRHAVRNERHGMLDAVLDSLPEDYGRVVRLYDLDGLPISEVSRRMGRSAGAIHMLRARAHGRFRELLGSQTQWFTSSS